MRSALIVSLALIGAIIWGFNQLIAQDLVEHDVVESSAGPVAVEQVLGGLEHPWALAFLPNGEMLITERGGKLLHITADGKRNLVYGLPPSEAVGQGGLLDVAVARDFEETGRIYVTFVAPDPDRTRTTLVSGTLNEARSQLNDVHVMWQQEPPIRSGRHFGSRIVEAPDGTILATIGDRTERPFAQDLDKTIGKVIRVTPEGTVPDDNPFADAGGDVQPQIFSSGHRNPQGMTLDPETGEIWIVDHGARGGDELNRIEAGKNYGWPVISYGEHYRGGQIGEGTHKEGMEQPVHYWDPSIAPSGLMIYSGKLWPEWKGDIFVGALKFELISRLERSADGTEIVDEERLVVGRYGRIRDVREGPDGQIWFLTDEANGGLFKMFPEE